MAPIVLSPVGNAGIEYFVIIIMYFNQRIKKKPSVCKATRNEFRETAGYFLFLYKFNFEVPNVHEMWSI